MGSTAGAAPSRASSSLSRCSPASSRISRERLALSGSAHRCQLDGRHRYRDPAAGRQGARVFVRDAAPVPRSLARVDHSAARDHRDGEALALALHAEVRGAKLSRRARVLPHRHQLGRQHRRRNRHAAADQSRHRRRGSQGSSDAAADARSTVYELFGTKKRQLPAIVGAPRPTMLRSKAKRSPRTSSASKALASSSSTTSCASSWSAPASRPMAWTWAA